LLQRRPNYGIVLVTYGVFDIILTARPAALKCLVLRVCQWDTGTYAVDHQDGLIRVPDTSSAFIDYSSRSEVSYLLQYSVVYSHLRTLLMILSRRSRRSLPSEKCLPDEISRSSESNTQQIKQHRSDHQYRYWNSECSATSPLSYIKA
jgi:hypothetical protein